MYRLARAFHWSEREIVSLTLKRRLAYLVLLDEEADTHLLAELEPGGPS